MCRSCDKGLPFQFNFQLNSKNESFASWDCSRISSHTNYLEFYDKRMSHVINRTFTELLSFFFDSKIYSSGENSRLHPYYKLCKLSSNTFWEEKNIIGYTVTFEKLQRWKTMKLIGAESHISIYCIHNKITLEILWAHTDHFSNIRIWSMKNISNISKKIARTKRNF